ncbi:Lrp/AsnC ligand binding domain-containing protein [Raineyella sp. LH-20]|uniref:Lrp/AsnC ligand binding domain-containing protein n=1 Tax=Raineyella sp. LH-20 TaxID=3081204 RepID=UPI002952D597|nr:Lrp/AsnC ligand binding domain-containing protein [Raineyella sp. LH-20]WOP18308.1 Lrp/AsnC ligand binding domain-containing protein [Raineyella sp. LH-20]
MVGTAKVEAYVLVQTEVGRSEEVTAAIRSIGGVADADGVTGPYDVIVRAHADDMLALGRLIRAVQEVDGITRTVTCPVMAE